MLRNRGGNFIADYKVLGNTKIKTPHKDFTIDDIIARSDVNEVLEGIVEKKADITELVAIYRKSDDTVAWVANELTYAECLWLLECVRQMLLTEEEED